MTKQLVPLSKVLLLFFLVAVGMRENMAHADEGSRKAGLATQTATTMSDKLYVAKPATEKGSFTSGIEGPGVDRDGNVYAVNFERQQTIGRLTPQGKVEVFCTLPNDSVGNGIRFNRQGMMFVADYVNHNVLKIDPRTKQIEVFAHNGAMNQPNDLALAVDGTLYASDPNWGDSTGQLWRIDLDGSTTCLGHNLGTTNGIEVSPDGKTLYVNESVQRKVWAFPIRQDGTLGQRKEFASFDEHSLDGMRCDTAGNLYVTRHGAGIVAKLSPTGELLEEIDVLGNMPSNICFGGPDGRTAYVTEVEHGRLVSFRVELPGLAWEWLYDAKRESQ
ncbi:MAG: SMP-30/gluconolactonase/LRE family protein [Planctomycetes bacterium]|nr:SMP-30/gluconolactonase/LRE family protein [Planctomycetota bacterium]